MNVKNQIFSKCQVPDLLASEKDIKKEHNWKEKKSSHYFTFITVISSVLNEAGKLTSLFGFQQARYDER